MEPASPILTYPGVGFARAGDVGVILWHGDPTLAANRWLVNLIATARRTGKGIRVGVQLIDGSSGLPDAEARRYVQQAFAEELPHVRRFINASSLAEVVFTRGTTESINLVAASFGQRLTAGDEVLITGLEHHSNIVPWPLLCERTGARLVVAPIRDDGSLDMAAFDRLLGTRTRIVAFAHVSNALGTVNPIAEMIAKAHAAGAVAGPGPRLRCAHPRQCDQPRRGALACGTRRRCDHRPGL